jgi:hypothetical protein
MIRCLLIQVSRNHQGLPVCKENTIAGESIQIGRGAACKLHLRDHRVSLLHATVRRSEDGTLYIEGENVAAININGFIEQRATLDPGTRVEIGPYLIIVGPSSDGHDIVLSVEMIQAPPEQEAAVVSRTEPVTLAALGLSKHKLGVVLAAIILFFFLLLPMLPSASSALDSWQASLPVTLTESWNPGPLSDGHRVFGAQCSICHQRPFHAVSDDACMKCHGQVAKHLAIGDSDSVAFTNLRCTHCHIDHKGKAGLVLHDSSGCVGCHGDIKSKSAGTALANVHDFGTDHPPFHITVFDGKNTIRVRQEDKEKLVEKSGLKFSHQLHLVKEGVSSPEGNTVMVCRDCHKLDESGIHFAPMTMQRACQQSRCHELYFDGPGEGSVPHGSEREVMNALRQSYTKWLSDTSAKNMASCKFAGATGNPVQRTLECANELAQKNAAASLFRESGENLGCGGCHDIVSTGDKLVPWKVAPLRINRDLQPGAVFAHSKHATANCTECHDKTNSTSSAEIALPTIEKCRECHVGVYPAKRKISSSCDSCHRFHRSTKTANN